MHWNVDVAIIGAGSAGLSALREVRKVTESFVLINDGPYGTTCARVGCMPSKALIQVADDYHRRHVFGSMGIAGAESLRIDIPAAMRHVRTLRDRFVRSVLKSTEDLGDRNIHGRARFVGPGRLQVENDTVEARKIVIATGSRPAVPAPWKGFGDLILTSDTIFEQEDLPRRLAVVGLGPIGLELGQALCRMGVETVGLDRSEGIGGLTDPKVIDYAAQIIGSEFPVFRNQSAELERCEDGIEVASGGEVYSVDKVLACIGTRADLEDLGLETLGIELDDSGMPPFDPCTMQIGDLPVFIAGDANGHRPVLHEAADEGFIAGYNSVHEPPVGFERRTPLLIVFSQPQIAVAGSSFADLDGRNLAVGEASFERQGRALIGAQDKGLLRVYADPETGRILGCEMMAPAGEHLAHLLGWSMQQGLTVFDATRMPVYHPVLEEGLRTALRDCRKQLGGGRRLAESDLCDSAPEKGLD